MAFPIIASDLSEKECAQIMDDLEIKPIVKDAAKLESLMKFRGSKTALTKTELPPFKFAVTSAPASDDAPSTLRVPLFYAREKFGAEAVSSMEGPWAPLSPEFIGDAAIKIPERAGQTEILREAYEHLLKHNTTTLEVPPGTGKTILAIMLALKLGLRFAILLPNDPLIFQWVVSFVRVTTGRDDPPEGGRDGASAGSDPTIDGTIKVLKQFAVETRRAEDGAAAPKRRKKNAPPPPVKKRTQCIIALGGRALGLTEAKRDSVGTVIIDEAHKTCVPSWVDTLLSFSPKYVIALSATVERQDGTHRMVHLLAGPHRVYRIPERPFKVIAYHTGVGITETINRYTKLLDYTKYCLDLAEHEVFNERIVGLVEANPARKFIVLFKLVKHAEKTRDTLEARGIASALMCGTRRSYVDCRVLCGTASKIGTGFDVATSAQLFDGRSPDAMILVNGPSSWQNWHQQVGRVMRAASHVKPAVIWMLTQNSVSLKHFKALKPYIVETAGEITTAVAPDAVDIEALCL